MIKPFPTFKVEKEIQNPVKLEKENQPVEKEEKENKVELNEEKENQQESKEEIQEIIPEIKYTPHEKEKLMNRLMSAKGVNKGLTKTKEIGKSKASEKIMGLANMLNNRIGPKQVEDSHLKNTFLLTNDADIQLYNEDNKLINLENKILEESEKPNEVEKENKKSETKDLVDIILDKPIFKGKIVKKRTQIIFKLKDES